MSSAIIPKLSFDVFHNIINGSQKSSNNFTCGINPATCEKLWDVPIADQDDVNDAVGELVANCFDV